MILQNGKLVLRIEEDKEKLDNTIKELEKLKRLIVESSQYRIQDGKTQMVDANEELEIRSRLEHTNNVTIICKTILKLIYEKSYVAGSIDKKIYDLNKKKECLYIEIVALAHDLGHTPFGHSGEEILNEFVKSIEDKETIKEIIQKRVECFGEEYEGEQGHIGEIIDTLSFEHNEQSAIEFFEIIKQNDIDTANIDVKRIISGVLAHSISRVPKVPDDLIAQIVRQSDKIEYRNFDFEELKRYINIENIKDNEIITYLQLSNKERIKRTIEEMVEEAIEKGKITDDSEAMQTTKLLRKIYENVIYMIEDDGDKELLEGNNRERNQMIYAKLLQYYYNNPQKIPHKSLKQIEAINPNKPKKKIMAYDRTKKSNKTVLEEVIQYVNTFTNSNCEKIYRRLVLERIVKGQGYGIEPITEQEIEQRRKSQIQNAMDRLKARELYKASKSHTDAETLRMLRYTNQKFKRETLTKEALDKIEENKVKKQKQNEVEYTLNEIMKTIDKIRAEKSDKNQIKQEVLKYIEKAKKYLGIKEKKVEFHISLDEK